MSEATSSTFPVLDSPARRALMETLTGLPARPRADGVSRTRGMTASELAGRMGLHVSTVRFHLERLASAGLVECHTRPSGVGRPRQFWTATRSEVDDGDSATAHMLAEVLRDSLQTDDPVAAEEAGRRWAVEHATELGLTRADDPSATPGRWLARVGAIVDVLDRWGYEPTVSTSDGGRTTELCLRSCPLPTLVRANPAVACAVHRGVIAGALVVQGEVGTDVTLQPFVRPDECAATLTRQTPFARSSSGKALT